MAIPRAVLILLVFAAPLALASPIVDQGEGLAMGIPLAPQLRCEIVYTAADAQACDVFGAISGANELRITMATGGQHVHAFAYDRIAPTLVRQLVVADCSGGCVARFPATTTSHAELYIQSTGTQGAILYVALDTAAP